LRQGRRHLPFRHVRPAGALMRQQHELFRPSLSTAADVDGLLGAGAAVAISVSGGKDSQAAALAAVRHLDAVGHRGPRVLIHSDLGAVEWADSATVCAELAQRLGLELITVQRAAGGLMERWEARWASSVRRYVNLETVTLVLPWSTPAMRFCTSELKTQVIMPALRRRFPGMPLVNVTGIRRQESASRARQSVSSPDAANSRPAAPVLAWRPILDLDTDDVFEMIEQAGLRPHEAYTDYGSTRVSCCFCIMGSLNDLAAAARHPGNHAIYRRMVALELDSGFAFQGGRWLCDVAPHLLDPDRRASVPAIKQRAQLRQLAEAAIPKELLYAKGWPTFVPTLAQGDLIAGTRRQVAALTGLDCKYLDAAAVVERYRELFETRHPLKEAA